jgi:hypothetical protein
MKGKTVGAQLRAVKAWRAEDQHTGIGKSSHGHPYTYEHVDGPPGPSAAVYRVECYVPFVMPTPLHRNVYYVPADRLDEFFDGWDQHAETIVDIRPMTLSAALAEIEEFKQMAANRQPDLKDAERVMTLAAKRVRTEPTPENHQAFTDAAERVKQLANDQIRALMTKESKPRGR